MTLTERAYIGTLTRIYVADMEATHNVAAPLHAEGLLDDTWDARSIMAAADGALTFVQALRINRAAEVYGSLCAWAKVLGIENVSERCSWAEQRIREAGGARFLDSAWDSI